MSTFDYVNRIITGTNTEVLSDFDNVSIDLTVTSPPYDNLRDYKGYSFDFETLAEELYRVTKPGGVVVWVVSDATIKGSETGTSFKQAIYFKEIGFNLHDTMIYAKENPLPQADKTRYTQSFEYMFVFTKGKILTSNRLTEPCKNSGKTIKRTNNNEQSANRNITNVTKKEKPLKNIWNYKIGTNCSTKDKFAFGHPAIFPEKLAEDHILSWSNPDDVVLDPFGGSGTTAKMAKLNGRNFIHIDISEEYNEIARKRLEGVGFDGRS